MSLLKKLFGGRSAAKQPDSGTYKRFLIFPGLAAAALILHNRFAQRNRHDPTPA
jgi:hypothetical protein